MAIIDRILSKFRRGYSGSKQDQATPAAKLVLSGGAGQDLSCRQRPPRAGEMVKGRPATFTGVIAECSVVSSPNSEVRSNLESFVKGKQGRIMLERDLSNKHDRTAIKVIGVWQDEMQLAHIGQIGWIPSELAYKIAMVTAGVAIHASIIAGFEPAYSLLGPLIRIVIWC